MVTGAFIEKTVRADNCMTFVRHKTGNCRYATAAYTGEKNLQWQILLFVDKSLDALLVQGFRNLNRLLEVCIGSNSHAEHDLFVLALDLYY